MRYVFAILTVNVGWKKSVAAYQAVENLMGRDAGYFQLESLDEVLRDSKVGLWRIRTKGIWSIHLSFWENQELWYPRASETLIQFRKRLRKQAFGLGPAKAAFAIEMAYPFQQEVACMDRHMMKLYGYKGTPTTKCVNGVKVTNYKMNSPPVSTYLAAEKHWCETCKKYDLPSAIARHIYWDEIQSQPSTRYWSNVFENPWRNKYDPYKESRVLDGEYIRRLGTAAV